MTLKIHISPGISCSMSIDRQSASYTASRSLVVRQPACGNLKVATQEVRLLAEVRRNLGGMSPRALLGGLFLCSGDSVTTFEIRTSGLAENAANPMVASDTGRRGFNPGLPDEFAEAAIEGLCDYQWKLPAGYFTVDRAGYDIVESNSAIFRQTAMVLRAAVSTALTGDDPHDAIRLALEKW